MVSEIPSDTTEFYRFRSSDTIRPGAIVSRSMDCHTKRQLDIRCYSAWDGCETADKELNYAKGKDKTAYTTALGAFGERRKEYHQAVETLREHRAKHGC